MFHVENFLLFLLVFLNLIELMRYYLNVLTCLIEHRIEKVHFEVHMVIGLVLLEHVRFHSLLIVQIGLAQV